MKFLNKSLVVIFAVSATAAAIVAATADAQTKSSDAQNAAREKKQYFKITADGELMRPTDYRTWVYVGTPVTPNDMNNGKAAFPEFHNVYIDPASYDHYKRTGKWREDTILVKELVSVAGKQAVSGNGYFMGEFIGLEATVKSGRHFAKEPGNWAYFRFTDEAASRKGHLGNLASKAAALPANACNQCHQASAADDFVFTQHYPVLRAAKNFGSAIPENNPRDRGAKGTPKNNDMKDASAGSGDLNFDQSGRAALWQATQSTPASVQGTAVPTDQTAIFRYLKTGAYRRWNARESTSHPGRGPHTKLQAPVKTYMNDTLAASMQAENDRHPIGATSVKEMLKPDGSLTGWAVAIKTQNDSAAGRGWYWYEVTSTSDASEVPAIGNGVQGCVGCHAPGKDYVLTSWPLK